MLLYRIIFISSHVYTIGHSGHYCFVSDFKINASNIFPLNTVLAVDFNEYTYCHKEVVRFLSNLQLLINKCCLSK